MLTGATAGALPLDFDTPLGAMPFPMGERPLAEVGRASVLVLALELGPGEWSEWVWWCMRQWRWSSLAEESSRCRLRALACSGSGDGELVVSKVCGFTCSTCGWWWAGADGGDSGAFQGRTVWRGEILRTGYRGSRRINGCRCSLWSWSRTPRSHEFTPF